MLLFGQNVHCILFDITDAMYVQYGHVWLLLNVLTNMY